MFHKKESKKRSSILKTWLDNILSNRIGILGGILIVLFAFLVVRLYRLQIVEGEEHLDRFNYKVEKTITTSGSRGNIYDCNGKLLAYSKLAYSVTFANSDEVALIAEERSQESGKTVNESTVRNEIIHSMIQTLEDHGDSIIYNLPIILDGKDKLKFTKSGASLTRFLKEIYGIGNLDNLSGEDLLKAEAWLESDVNEVYEYLRTGKNGPLGCGNMFNIDEKYSVEDTLKIMSIRYDAYMNRYSQTTPITVANNVSEESIAALSECREELPGVSIETSFLRKYNKSKYVSSIIGYTGKISEDELADYNQNGGDYSGNDIVGKVGIEKSMEDILCGKKGYQNVLVDNLGKVIKTVEKKDAQAGSDVYLTIDTDLQEYAYHILERRLAGIVLAHMVEDSADTEKNSILFSDVLYALIDNNVVDVSGLKEKTNSENEKQVLSIFKNKQKTVFHSMREKYTSSNKAYNNISEENQNYMDMMLDVMLEEKLLNISAVDETDNTYQAWKEGTISFKSYITYAINKEWIDIDQLDIQTDYYDVNDILSELVNTVVSKLENDNRFDKLLFKHMIKKREINGKRICLLLYDQKILKRHNDKDYTALMNDEISSYTFMYNKIYNIEITPAQLALDPCSGSIVITDPDNGDVKAMVSYPSYNNNKLSNGIDAEYFAKINEDNASPMLNRCTQTRTAPGSTFKPISATAVLEEKIISKNTAVNCTGIFDKITPNAKCWIYPDAHKKLNVSEAIAVSCNNFFYEMGYRLGSQNGAYDSDEGLAILGEYAKMYGLDQKSGVEITEYQSQLSDEDAVRSSIGQGTHNYTPSQISRYLTSLVNQKNLLQLTLLEKTVNSQGTVTEEKKEKVDAPLKVSDQTFSVIKKGMVNVVNGKKSSIKFLYEGTGLKVAGKTGTAQENKNRPNHALFISYAPYEKPEVTMTVVIRNGYTSTNAAEIARDIYKYYFKKTTKAEKEAKEALMPSGSDASND